ncbi:MAG: DUF4130 domain-containing protein [Candidatus Woesearchaeota archaeon]|jgi:probable DNA metabolism protein
MSEVLDCFYLADRHNKFNSDLLKKVEMQNIGLVMNVATPEARQLYEMHTNVARAICKIKSFLRFDISLHGILYTSIDSEHHIVDDLLYFFHERFPIFHIAIFDKKKTYVISSEGLVSVYDLSLKDVVLLFEKKLPVLEIMKDFSYDEDLWEKYYDSQFILERKNLRLMKSMMPLKYRSKNSAESFISNRTKKLLEYCN